MISIDPWSDKSCFTVLLVANSWNLYLNSYVITCILLNCRPNKDIFTEKNKLAPCTQQKLISAPFLNFSSGPTLARPCCLSQLISNKSCTLKVKWRVKMQKVAQLCPIPSILRVQFYMYCVFSGLWKRSFRYFMNATSELCSVFKNRQTAHFFVFV